ncbi:hemolysin, partial [Fusobacterium necrophorum BFTR-2]
MKKLVIAMMISLFTVAYAGDIVVDQEKSKNLHIDKAPNNVPLVNIEAPNSQGTSHNVFREYNVGKEGVILNNALDLENSKLGGLIYGNPNLQKDRKTASTILTEISGTHRSKLEGFTEIVGGKADYILANPNGIYINGAGFINTGNVKMMTAGSQNNFEVESGKIEIAGKGLDVRNINKAELIARVAELSAPIYGGEELNIALGSKSQKDKPEYSLDARALGSMYAGRIHIVSSEDGVGVKSAAPMYATKGDVILDTKGKVYLKDTQAKNNISIKAKETQVEEKLIAEKGIKLASEKIRNRGNLAANTNIIMQGDVENEKWIFSNGTVNISGNIKNKGEIKAKHHITLRGEELENRGLILSHQNLNIHSRDIHNFDKLIAENNVEIENDRIKNIGKIYSDQNIKINSRKIENHKDILALGNIELESKTLVNNEKIQANGNIHIRSKNIESENIFANHVTINTDTIESNKIITQGNIDIHAQKIKNRGKTYSKENTNIVAKEIENLGEMTSSGKIDIDTTKMDTNKILAKQDIHIKAKKLKTKEKIYSENNITINSDEIENHKDMLALGNIHMENKTLINHERIQANGNITIQSKELTSAGSIVNKGLIQSKNNVTLTAKEIQNYKKILSEQDITLESKTLKNLDHIAGKNKVNIKNENLDNKHVIYSDNQLEISSNEVDLHEKIAAKNLLKLHTKNLKRDKAYITNSDIEIDIDGNYENNFELIGKNFTLTAKDVINNSIIAGREKVIITGKNDFINKENSLLYSGNDLELSGKHLENQGDIAAGRNLKFQFSGDIKNLTANIEAGGDIYVKAMNFVNQGHITGDYSKRWVRGYESNIDVSKLPKEFLTKIDKILERKRHGRKFRGWDEDKRLKYAEQGVSHYISHKSYLKAGGDIQLEIAKDIRNQEADILADKNISIKAERLINTREGKEIPILLDFARRYHYRYWRHGKNRTGHGNIHARKYWKETLYSDKSTQIIAGGNISIAANRIGNGEEKAYTTSSHLNSIHAPNKTNNVHPEDTFTNHSSIDETFHVNHNSLVKKIKQDSSIGVTDYIDIPKNDHGMFIVNKEKKNPKFSYFIETNPKLIEKGFYLSSDYFFSRIQFNPDRDIRLLGDSFYENKLITKAVLEGIGRRYLYSDDVNQERKQLFDNAIQAQKDLHLSLGITLTKEQINNLKSDILWYVEEEVAGEKVLVPKLFLSKNTLKTIVEEQGNIMKAGGSFVINNASIVDNSGKIVAKNNVIVNSENIYQNAAYSDTGIYATNIDLVAKENIENIGGNMIAAKDISMYSENGDIKNRKKLSIHENDLRHIFTDVRASGNITGKNVKIVANTLENLGADIKAKENLEIGARKNLEIGSLEAVEQRKSVGKKHTVLDRKTSNVGSKLQAKEIHLTALQDIHVRGSNLFAEEKVNLSAKGNIDIVAGKNTTLHQEEHHKSKSFGRSSSSTDVEYSTESVASNVIGDKVNIISEKNISLLGSHLQANTEGNIVADGNITQAGVKDIHYSFHETSKRGAFGLTKKTKSQESYQEEAVKSATVAGEQGAYYDAKHDLVLEGVNVVSTGKVTLQGKNISLKPLETTSWTEVKEKKRGFAGSIGNGGVSVSYGTDKKSQKDTQKTQNISEITSGKTLTIAAEETLTGSSVNLYGREGIRLTGEEGIHLSTAKNTREVQQKQSSTRVGANIGVKSELLNTVENIKNLDKLVDSSGDGYAVLNTASNLVGAIKDGSAALNHIMKESYGKKTNAKGKQDLANDNYRVLSTNWKDYLSAGVSLTKKKAESRNYQEEVVQNQMESEGNIVLSSKQGSISLEGTEIKTPKDVKLLAKEKVEVRAAEQKNAFSSSSSQRGAGLDMNGSLTASASGQKGRGEGTSYVNSHIKAGGDYQVLAKEILHEGANVKAGTIHMKGEKILVASKQDTSHQKDSSYGGSLSFSVNPKVALNSV